MAPDGAVGLKAPPGPPSTCSIRVPGRPAAPDDPRGLRDEVEPQALEHDRIERFNLQLFRKIGALDLLGLTVPPRTAGPA